MKCLKHAALALVLAAGGCVAPVGPVEVTRFHVADVAMLGKGTIAVEPAAGMDGASLEWRTYQAAVQQQLALLGYAAPQGTSAQVAELRLSRMTIEPSRGSGPVSVGVGGSTGSWGSGVGVGIGINLTPRSAQQVQTTLAVTIRERASKAALWEGRAQFTVHATSPMADTALAAPKLAAALFKDFPGQSGETIVVK